MNRLNPKVFFLRSLKGMFWQNNKKNRVFDECLGILDFLRKWLLRADVSKYRPDVYKSEKSKILKKIHKVALGKLLT